MGRIIKLTENDIVRIVKKVLSEQPISPIGATSRINLSKLPRNIKSSQWSGKTPRVEDGSPSISDCKNPTPYDMVVKQYFSYCNKNKSKYSGSLTPNQKYLIQDLHKSMEGLFSTGTLNLIEKISNLSDFCRVALNYNYDNSERPGKNDLYSWLEDEKSIQWIDVAELLSKFQYEAEVETCLDGIPSDGFI
jgi:hypothetical protein